ncbi:hypothetical protein CN130_15855, partial [Sinorhizobium meliloti]
LADPRKQHTSRPERGRAFLRPCGAAARPVDVSPAAVLQFTGVISAITVFSKPSESLGLPQASAVDRTFDLLIIGVPRELLGPTTR